MADPGRESRISMKAEKSYKGAYTAGGRESITSNYHHGLGAQPSQGHLYGEAYPSMTQLPTGGIQEKAALLFRSYDKENRNHLEYESLMSALAELGVLNGLTSKKLSEIMAFGGDISAKNRTFSFHEFSGCYERLSNYQNKAARAERIKNRVQMPGPPEGAERNELIKRTFVNYCKYTVGQGRLNFDESDPRMSSTQFVKLCQDLGLVQPTGPLNVVTIDIIFHKCKPIGGRRFGLMEYIKALAAAMNDSGLDVFERVGVLGSKIQLSHIFVAPEPIVYRQETRPIKLSMIGSPTDSVPDGESSTIFNARAGSVREAVANARNQKSSSATSPKSPLRGKPIAWGLGEDDNEDQPPWMVAMLERINDLELQLEAGEPKGLGMIAEHTMAASNGNSRGTGGESYGAGGESFEALEARVKGCEDADQLLQVAMSGINKHMPKTAAEAVKAAMTVQLGPQLLKRLKDKDGSALIKSIVASHLAEEMPKFAAQGDAASSITEAANSAGSKEAMERIASLEAKIKVADRAALQAKKDTDAAAKRLEAVEKASRSAGVASGTDDRKGALNYDDLLKRVLALEGRSAAAEQAAKQAGEREKVMADRLAALEAIKAMGEKERRAADAAIAKATKAAEAIVQRLEASERGSQGSMHGSASPSTSKGGRRGASDDVPGSGLGLIPEDATAESPSETRDSLDPDDYHARISRLEGMTRQLKAESEHHTVTARSSGLLGMGGMSLLRRNSTSDPDKVDSLERKQSSDAATITATVSKLVMRQELVEQKMGSASAAIAILEAEFKARLAELEGMHKSMEQRLTSTRETVELQGQHFTLQLNSKLSQLASKEGLEAKAAELARQIADGERAHKNLELRVASTREAMELQGQHFTLQLNSKLSQMSNKDSSEAKIAEMQRQIAEDERAHKQSQMSSKDGSEAKIAELARQIAEGERAHKNLELRVASTRETMEKQGQHFSLQLNSKLSGLTSKDGSEAKIAELERQIADGERAHKEISEAVQSMQVSISHGITSGVSQGPTAEEARLLVLLQSLQGDLQNFQTDYNTAIMYIKGDFEQMQGRLGILESGQDPRFSSYATLVEIKELENHLMSRIRLLSDDLENQQKAVNAVIDDLGVVSTKAVGGGVDTAIVQDIQTQLQLHLDTVYQDIMSQLETKWATNEALQLSHDKSRGNYEAIMEALKQLDKRNQAANHTRDEILLRISRQIDYIQNYLRQQDETFQAPASGTPIALHTMAPRASFQGDASPMVTMGSMIRGMLSTSSSISQRHLLTGDTARTSQSSNMGEANRSIPGAHIEPIPE